MLSIAIMTAHLESVFESDPSTFAYQRAKELVAQMTLEEKIAQCMMDAPAIPRLKVPAYHYWSEALHGIARNGVATVFPQAIGLAATWDPDLMYQVATATSIEARGKFVSTGLPDGHPIYRGLTLWSPNVNIFRDPRWGRGQETYGEDPWLTGRMGVAFVKGIQGDDPAYLRAVATPKHFAVHSGPEPLRHQFVAEASDRELREFYLPAFEACVTEGKAASVMSAYSGFNGQRATASRWLLTDLLRGEWKFDGAVVGDVDSVSDLWTHHKVAKDRAEASAMAIKAGNDLCSGDTYVGLPEALKRGIVSESDIDQAAVRLFSLRFRLGMFDGPEKCQWQKYSGKDIDTPEHDVLALRAAEKSLVLLKNSGVLPLDSHSIQKVAIIGPVAESVRVLEGNYNGTPSRPVTLRKGITEALESAGVAVRFDEGAPLTYGMAEVRDLPEGTLFTDETCQTPGLKSQIYGGIALKGDPIATGVDRSFNFKWAKGAPVGSFLDAKCSARWTGVIRWPKDEEVELTVLADDGARVYFDGKLVAESWKDQPETRISAMCRLKANEPVKLKIEYYQNMGDAVFKLGFTPKNRKEIDCSSAVKLALDSDLTILALGITPDLEGEEMPVKEEGFAGGDRTTLELPGPQRELLRQIAATGKPLVLVTTSGSCISVPTEGVSAWLHCWYPGQQGGMAVARALLGQVNPAGRLPVTFYKSLADLPPFEDYHLEGRTYQGYRGKPLFPFGFGLSYARFKYGPVSLNNSGSDLAVSLNLTNESSVDGEEVVQVYARFAKPQPGDPLRRLVGFKRVHLPAGMTVPVEISILEKAIRTWNPTSRSFEVRKALQIIEVGPWAGEVKASLDFHPSPK